MCYNVERKRQIIKLNDNNFFNSKNRHEKTLEGNTWKCPQRLFDSWGWKWYFFSPLFSCFSPCTSSTHINPQIIYMLFSKGKKTKKKLIKISKFLLIDSLGLDSLNLSLNLRESRSCDHVIVAPPVRRATNSAFLQLCNGKGRHAHACLCRVSRATDEQVGIKAGIFTEV